MASIPRCIVEWPDGLTGQPTLKPIGDTLEQDQEIIRILERALAAASNGN